MCRAREPLFPLSLPYSCCLFSLSLSLPLLRSSPFCPCLVLARLRLRRPVRVSPSVCLCGAVAVPYQGPVRSLSVCLSVGLSDSAVCSLDSRAVLPSSRTRPHRSRWPAPLELFLLCASVWKAFLFMLLFSGQVTREWHPEVHARTRPFRYL